MKIYVIILIVLAVFSFSVANELVDFSKMKDWQPQDSALIYNSSNLWKYINGAAELFLNFGFDHLQSQDILKGELGATVDIYDMRDPLNAYGVYMTELAPNSRSLTIGAEAAVIPPYQCLMLKDRFYIKINIHKGQISEESGAALLKNLAEIIPGNAKLPKELDLLPNDYIVPGSFGFIRQGYQGLSELNNCVFAEYQDSISVYKIFLIPVKTNEVWEKLRDKWKTFNQEDVMILYRKTPYKGYIGAVKKGDNIIGVSGLQTKNELIKMLTKIGTGLL